MFSDSVAPYGPRRPEGRAHAARWHVQLCHGLVADTDTANMELPRPQSEAPVTDTNTSLLLVHTAVLDYCTSAWPLIMDSTMSIATAG